MLYKKEISLILLKRRKAIQEVNSPVERFQAVGDSNFVKDARGLYVR
jgi:hypothetical protein